MYIVIERLLYSSLSGVCSAVTFADVKLKTVSEPRTVRTEISREFVSNVLMICVVITCSLLMICVVVTCNLLMICVVVTSSLLMTCVVVPSCHSKATKYLKIESYARRLTMSEISDVDGEVAEFAVFRGVHEIIKNSL